MDNYDILKFKTFHNYNFDDIESSEFLDLFYKLVNVNDESDENAMEFEDQNKKKNEFSSEKKKEFYEEKSNKNEQEMSEDEHFQNQIAFLKTLNSSPLSYAERYYHIMYFKSWRFIKI